MAANPKDVKEDIPSATSFLTVEQVEPVLNATDKPSDRERLIRDIASVLNTHSVEDWSDTPDFILAEMVVATLEHHAIAVNRQVRWKRANAAKIDDAEWDGKAPATRQL